MRSAKLIFSLSKKLWTEKYPSSRFNHLSITYASINPLNNGISKFTCTLKGVSWSLDEDPSLVGSRRRICAKLSIILFLCCARDSSSNNLKGHTAPLTFLSSPKSCCQDRCNRSCKGSTGSISNFLYPDLVGDMHEEEYITLIPLVQI